jgi:hypothetical protein
MARRALLPRHRGTADEAAAPRHHKRWCLGLQAQLTGAGGTGLLVDPGPSASLFYGGHAAAAAT